MPTKKQHFVPRVYLKAWETQVETLKEPDKKFKGIYVIKDGKKILRVILVKTKKFF